MIALRFNGEQFYNDLRDRLVQAMEDLNSEFFRDATSGMSSEARSASEKDKAVVEGTTDYKGALPNGINPEYINARCRFYTDAILESFGTGQLADTYTPSGQLAWKSYKESGSWNPARGTGGRSEKVITGRPAGKYTNLWGEDEKSSGRNKGKNLEGLHLVNRKGEMEQVKPKNPTYSIQNAEVWIMQDRETKMERRIEQTVIKFISDTDISKYFYYMDD